MRVAFAAVAGVLVALIVLPCMCISAEAAQSNNLLLVDYGNGSYGWYNINQSGSYLDVLESCIDDVSYSGGSLTINGMGCTTISGNSPVTVDWKIYSWDGNKWKYEGTNLSAKCGGTFALGLFSDQGILPSATPDEPTVWTQLGGSSNSNNTSPSYGPSSPALPVEWYNTYVTGFVDSGLVVAGNLLYHTTGGTYGGTGSNADAWIYCVDRNSGEIVWKYEGSYGAGYEVTTPAIAGDYLIVTTTNGDLYVLDRFTGDLIDKINIPFNPPVDSGGNIMWDGRTFVTGGTTPVYDSGCIFFGSADGKVYCYALSVDGKLSEEWCYDPPATGSLDNYTGSKGCFYYFAPVIASIDGARMLFIGNYEGYVHALEITTGKAVWVKRVIDMRDDNRCVPHTPGSAASISVSPDGTILLVTCTDGGLFTLSGYIAAFDPKTGAPLKFSDGTEWKINGLFTSPVVTGDGFYTYVSPTGSGNNILISADGGTMATYDAVYKFNWDGKVEWASKGYQMIKAPLTLANGVLYAMDYSAGAFWPTGGAVTAISAENGSQLWRVLLSPYTSASYSMVQPTVIDGKIYTANDFGAVYCLSTTAGAGTEEERIQALETQGFHHWSWWVLAFVIILSLLLLIILY